ncbi:MAG: MarR family transcriptional regulator [Paracoccaceae bacterium]|nr:MarR family transcriptional regulator [Paracoccaceae bacterium]MDE2912852.1 MarR family transcriptional regulator [Paracoccaceae bacterium]
MQDQPVIPRQAGREPHLFLTDDQLLQGIELMFFAYREFTSDPDRILERFRYGRAHHRAIHFINRSPGITVNRLLTILGVTKQSLNRVRRRLMADGMIISRVGTEDRRERHLYLTESGRALERQLSEAQRRRMRAAYRAAGPDAVQGFRRVLENIMDDPVRQLARSLGED